MSQKVSSSGRKMCKLFLSLATLVLAAVLATSALAGDLRAYFDRTSAYEGDKVTLVIESTSGNLGEPDLSALDADFDLLGTSQSTNISIINGQRTDTVRLLVNLAPRRTGTLEVPPIKVGGEQTQPLRLEVSKVPEGGTGGSGDDIFLELEVGADSGGLMVQQQVPVTLRLFTAVPLLNGRLEDPRAEGTLVTKLGEDREYETRRNGRQYRVIERSYSLSPERSGELHIPPVRFEGSVRDNQGRGRRSRRSLFEDPFFDRFFQDSPLSSDPFGMFERGRSVSARSRGLTLDVKARPEAYAGEHWLPAQDLEILDSWADSPPDLRVGEPFTRTLTLKAKGLSGPQIPQIEIPSAPGLRIYPEKPESESRSDGETIYGISRQSLNLIPTRAGDVSIPEIRVTWWNTGANHEQVTTVPGWTLKATGGGGAETASEPPAQTQTVPISDTSQGTAEQTEKKVAEDVKIEGPLTPVDRQSWIAGAVLLLLILVGAWGFYRYRRRSRPAIGSADKDQAAHRNGTRARASEARKALRIACEANDARGAATALLRWAEVIWPGDVPRNLGALAARATRGVEELRGLERHLYAPDSGHWKGAALWQAAQGGLSDESVSEHGKGEDLEPLYPHRG